MSGFQRSSRRFAFWAAVLAVCLAGSSRAQVAIQVAPAPVSGRIERAEEDDSLIDETPPRDQTQFGLADANFDAWVFNNGRQGVHNRQGFDDRLTLRLAEIDRECRLTDAQKAKLRLAGRGDTKRFFDLLEEKHRVFQQLKNDRNKINDIFQQIAPLQKMVSAGVFNRSSFFGKTLGGTLTTGQNERLERVENERRAYRYRAAIDMTAVMLGESLGFTSDQHRQFVDLLQHETTPPRMFPESNMYIDYEFVMYRASRLPSERLRPLFDNAQWRVLEKQLEQHKMYDRMLRQNGMLDAIDDSGELWPLDRVFAR